MSAWYSDKIVNFYQGSFHIPFKRGNGGPNPQKMSTFSTGIAGNRHIGVRTIWSGNNQFILEGKIALQNDLYRLQTIRVLLFSDTIGTLEVFVVLQFPFWPIFLGNSAFSSKNCWLFGNTCFLLERRVVFWLLISLQKCVQYWGRIGTFEIFH